MFIKVKLISCINFTKYRVFHLINISLIYNVVVFDRHSSDLKNIKICNPVGVIVPGVYCCTLEVFQVVVELRNRNFI